MWAKNKLGFSLLVWASGIFFWCIGFAPGVLSPDSFNSWQQIQSWNFDDWHPVSYTLWLWLTSLLGQNVFFASILQSLLLNYSVFLLVRTILKDRPLHLIVLITAFLQFTPFIGLMGVTLWKDVSSTALVMIGIVKIISAQKTNNINIFVGMLCLALGLSMRHDSLLFIAVSIFLYFIEKITFKTSKINRSQLGTSYIAVAAILGLSVGQILPTILNATPTPNYVKVGPLLHDLTYASVVSPQNIPIPVLKRNESFVTGQARIAARDCNMWDKMAMSPGLNIQSINESGTVIIRDWVSTFFSKGTLSLIKGHACRAKAFIPILPPEIYVWTYQVIDSNSFGVSKYNMIPKLSMISSSWASSSLWSKFGNIVGWPGAYLAICLFAFFFYTKKKLLTSELYVICFLGIAKGISNIVYVYGPFYRYGFITQVCGIILLISLYKDFIRVQFKVKFGLPS